MDLFFYILFCFVFLKDDGNKEFIKEKTNSPTKVQKKARVHQ